MSGQANGHLKATRAVDAFVPSIGFAPAVKLVDDTGAKELPPAEPVAQSGWPDAPPPVQLRLGKHRSLYRAGDKAEHLFEVESGAVMVHRILSDGRRQLIEIVFPGGFCGLSTGDRHESDCETLTPTVVRSYKKADLTRSHLFCARILERLRRQLLSLHDHIVSLGRLTAEERVCSFILRLFATEQGAGELSDGNAERAISLPLTRNEMADYLGLTIGTVCRTLSSLSDRKLVELGRNKIQIKVLDLERMRKAACWEAG